MARGAYLRPGKLAPEEEPSRRSRPRLASVGKTLPDGATYTEFQSSGDTTEFRAGWPQGIAPLGLPQIRTCPFRHTAPHIMNALRDGTLSGSQPVVGADTVPASGRIDPREWSPYGVAGRAISSRYRSQTIGIGTEQ